MDCDCGKKYVGETSLKVSTRLEQHKDPGRKMGTHWYSGNAQNCQEGLKWIDVEFLKVLKRKFDRIVREALEIQFQEYN